MRTWLVIEEACERMACTAPALEQRVREGELPMRVALSGRREVGILAERFPSLDTPVLSADSCASGG
jgi:hypothetical protein